MDDNARLDLRNMTVDSNGLGAGNDTREGIKAYDGSHLYLNSVTLSNNGSGLRIENNSEARLHDTTVSGNGDGSNWSDAIEVKEKSQISLRNSTIASPKGHGLHLSYWSKADVSNSSIVSADPGDGNQPNAIYLWRSQLNFNHDSNENSNTISLTSPGYTILARGRSEVVVQQALTLNTNGSSSPEEVALWEGSDLWFFESQSPYTIPKVYAYSESKIHVHQSAQVTLTEVQLNSGSHLNLDESSSTVDGVTCWGRTTTSGQSIDRPSVIFFNNGDNSTVSSIGSDCGVVQ